MISAKQHNNIFCKKRISFLQRNMLEFMLLTLEKIINVEDL